jgi:hypothetical protein
LEGLKTKSSTKYSKWQREGWLAVIETYALHIHMYDNVCSLTIQYISTHVWRYSRFWALAFLSRYLHSSLSSARLLRHLIPRILQHIHCVRISRNVRANTNFAALYICTYILINLHSLSWGIIYSTTYRVDPDSLHGSCVPENRRVCRKPYATGNRPT